MQSPVYGEDLGLSITDPRPLPSTLLSPHCHHPYGENGVTQSSAPYPAGLPGIRKGKVSPNKRNLDSQHNTRHRKHEMIFLLVQIGELVA